MFNYKKVMRSKVPPTVRVVPEEWDFSRVTPNEARACCYYEYARESTYVVENLEEPRPYDQSDPQHHQLLNSPLTLAMQPPPDRSKMFEGPWLLKDADWRRRICVQFEEHDDGLSFARLLDRTPDRAFQVGIAPPFPSDLWTEKDTKVLDEKTGLELLLVTIDWANFDDGEIVNQFKRWTNQNRPLGMHDKKGKRPDVFQKGLEKLAALRLRHYYPFGEIEDILPEAWTGNKFWDKSEMTRTCMAAHQSLHLLFPFLEKGTLPINWEPFPVVIGQGDAL